MTVCIIYKINLKVLSFVWIIKKRYTSNLIKRVKTSVLGCLNKILKLEFNQKPNA